MILRTVFIYFILAIPLFSEINYNEYRKEVLNLGNLKTSPRIYAAEGYVSDGIVKPIFYDGLDYKGNATRVYAYLGVPKSEGKKLPAMVLVHGGGGTAFKELVKKWNEHGYAAISIAVEGQTDMKVEGKKGWVSHQWAGPKRQGVFQDHQEKLSDQWMYHAIADVVLAQTLLASMPEIDSQKIGLMGISWGGIITSTVMGIDHRFAFVIPTYGCGALHKIDNHYGKILKGQSMYQEVWDPMQRMELAKMPALWLSWTGDTHFHLDVQSLCYKNAPGKRMVSYIQKMGHSHNAGWNPEDSYAFADSVLKNKEPWCEQVSLSEHSLEIKGSFRSMKDIQKVTLISTLDSGPTHKRKWQEVELNFTQNESKVTMNTNLTEGSTAWFINLYSGKLTASSDFQGE